MSKLSFSADSTIVRQLGLRRRSAVTLDVLQRSLPEGLY